MKFFIKYTSVGWSIYMTRDDIYRCHIESFDRYLTARKYLKIHQVNYGRLEIGAKAIYEKHYDNNPKFLMSR